MIGHKHLADWDPRKGLRSMRRLDRLIYALNLPMISMIAWFAAVFGRLNLLLVAFGIGMFAIAVSIFSRDVMRQLEAVIAEDEGPDRG